jgi:hypothetical protein
MWPFTESRVGARVSVMKFSLARRPACADFVARLGGPRLFKTGRALTRSICPGAGHGHGPRTVKGHALRFVAVGRTINLGWRSMGSCVIEAHLPVASGATRAVWRTAAVEGFEAFDDPSQPVR